MVRNMLSSLETVRDTLAALGNFGHYEAVDTSQPYGVWAEDSESGKLVADNYKPGQTIQGTIDWFTKDEDDPMISAIPVALNGARIGWSLNSVQYEEETGYIHYEWLFRVLQAWPDGNSED